MMMKFARLGLLFAIGILLSEFAAPTMLSAQTASPFFGTWKLNPEKSTADNDRYKRVITKIEPWQDGIRVIYDLVGTRGGVTHMEWIGKFDGRDYAVQGVDYVLTNAYRLTGDRSYEVIVKVDGAVAATTRVSVSQDGKTLTATTTETTDRTPDRTTISVYDSQ
jgi:hypothetical protein